MRLWKNGRRSLLVDKLEHGGFPLERFRGVKFLGLIFGGLVVGVMIFMMFVILGGLMNGEK